jgi:CheY-like chemotaxis protein
MKVLVVEQNKIISKIYKKIFLTKNYDADFAVNELECLERVHGKYDYVVIDTLENDSNRLLESKIKKIKPSQKIFSLSSSSKGLLDHKDALEIIEKPFALLTMVAKLESKRENQNN